MFDRIVPVKQFVSTDRVGVNIPGDVVVFDPDSDERFLSGDITGEFVVFEDITVIVVVS